jgi:hypothetical protein
VRFLIITFSQKPVTPFFLGCVRFSIITLSQKPVTPFFLEKKGVTGFCENVIIKNLTQTRKKGVYKKT